MGWIVVACYIGQRAWRFAHWPEGEPCDDYLGCPSVGAAGLLAALLGVYYLLPSGLMRVLAILFERFDDRLVQLLMLALLLVVVCLLRVFNIYDRT